MAAEITSFAGFSHSMPSISPLPVMLFTPLQAERREIMYSLRLHTPSSISSSSLERMLSAPAQQMGFPPKVEP